MILSKELSRIMRTTNYHVISRKTFSFQFGDIRIYIVTARSASNNTSVDGGDLLSTHSNGSMPLLLIVSRCMIKYLDCY